jgi:RNA-binding protein 39
MEQLNGFEIAGRPMKVGYVTEKSDNNHFHNPQTFLDTDEMDRAGVNLGVTGRLQLMAKLAEGKKSESEMEVRTMEGSSGN